MTRLHPLSAAGKAALLLFLACGAGCGDTDATKGGPADASRRGDVRLDADAILVPLSGSDPAHVVGAVSFDRFRLLTTKDGRRAPPPKPSASDAATTSALALHAKAVALLEKNRIRPAAGLFLAAADAARFSGSGNRG